MITTFLSIFGAILVFAAVIMFLSKDSSMEHPKAYAFLLVILAILLFVAAFAMKDEGGSKSDSNSNKEDYWKCPSCGSYVDKELNWCPNCVKEGLKDELE